MRKLWIKITYFWFIFMLILVGLFSGNLKVKADTLSYDLGEYRLKYYMGNTSTWIGPYNFGSSVSTTSYDYIEGVAVRLGSNSNFIGSKEYLISIELGALPTTNAINNNYLSPTEFSCYGSTSLTNWSQDSSKVESCEYIGAQRVGQTSHLKYLYKIRMTQDIKGVQINIYFPTSPPYGIDSFRVYKATKITYGEDVSGAIDEQTIIIQNEIKDLTEVINENNQNLIESITEQNQVCEDIDKNNIEIDNKYLDSNGNYGNSNNYGVTKYIKIDSKTTIKVITSLNSDSAKMCFYNINKELIQCNTINNNLVNTTLTIPTNASYFRSSIQKVQNKPTFNICKNGNQAIQDSVNDINDTLTSDEVDSPSSSLEEMQDMLPTNGTITQLIALPLSLYQKVLNSINGTCQSFTLGNLYGTNLIMPCVDLDTYLGNTLWNTIDLIISGIFVLTIGRKMIKAFEGFTSMKEGDVIND